MTLPNQNTRVDDEDRMSKSEVEHLFARREARRDIDRLTTEMLEINKKLLESNTKQALESQALREMVAGLPNMLAVQIARCREEIRLEIHQNYPTRLENLEMRNHIENQVKEVDSTLGKQIAAVDRKLSEEIKTSHATLSEEIKGIATEVKNDLRVQWLKITIPIAVIGALATALTWWFSTGSKITGNG